MNKVSEWSTEEECGYCGVKWEIYATDFVERRNNKYRAYCDNCGNTIRVESIPRMYSSNFSDLVDFNKMFRVIKNSGKNYEMRYVKNNSAFFK